MSESPVDRSFIVYTPGFCETAVLTEGFHLPHQCLVRVAETEDVCDNQGVKICESFKAHDGVREREVQTKISAVPDRTFATSLCR